MKNPHCQLKNKNHLLLVFLWQQVKIIELHNKIKYKLHNWNKKLMYYKMINKKWHNKLIN